MKFYTYVAGTKIPYWITQHTLINGLSVAEQRKAYFENKNLKWFFNQSVVVSKDDKGNHKIMAQDKTKPVICLMNGRDLHIPGFNVCHPKAPLIRKHSAFKELEQYYDETPDHVSNKRGV